MKSYQFLILSILSAICKQEETSDKETVEFIEDVSKESYLQYLDDDSVSYLDLQRF